MTQTTANRWIYASAVVLLLLAATKMPAAERPNILWLTAEDMSATLGCYGDAYADTPHIDQLAKESVKYTNAFATAPVCSPARSCLITGCYATSLGTQRLRSAFPIPESIGGFPERLRRVGYYCTNNVKTDYNTANEAAIIRASWDESSATAHWRTRKSGQSFFCVFNDMISHQSRTMVWPYDQFREEVQNRLDPATIHDPQTAPVPPYYPDIPIVRTTVARYYDCVTAMDQNVGRLLEQLEEDGLADDTIVFFFSDHGSGMPRHKRALLDSGMHVPLLIRFPEKYQHLAPAKPGETIDRLVSFVDFAPSLLSLCGLEIPGHMQGTSFLGAAAGPPRQYVYGARDRVDEVFDVARSVRNQRYLYIRNFMPHLSYHQPSGWPDQSEFRRQITRFVTSNRDALTDPQRHYAGPTRPLEELYDAQTDPMNLNNLADSRHHRETLETLRQELIRWMVQTRDLGFLPEDEAWRRSRGKTPWRLARDEARYPLQHLIEAASLVGRGERSVEQLEKGLQDDDSAARYWAAVGFTALGEKAASARACLQAALEDPAPAVRIEAANALLGIAPSDEALAVLNESLESENPDVVLHAARTVELLGDVARAAAPSMRTAHDRFQGEAALFIHFSTEAFLREIVD